MTRSHPPSVLRQVERIFRQEIQLGPRRHVLVAVSGGLDSMVLLHALSRLRERLKLQLTAHGVDHGLREEAASELDLAERLARECAVPFGRTSVQVAAGGNLQARARAARHEALRAARLAANADWIATAHHADDRAETLLLRLLRGSSARGLGVLPPQAGPLIRPLLRVRRAEISAHAARHELRYACDPSNQNLRFMRVRVRQELMPVLEQLSPGIVGHLNALAEELANPPDTLPELPDPDLVLGREQRRQLALAIAEGTGRRRVRVSGARELRFDPQTGGVEILTRSSSIGA